MTQTHPFQTLLSNQIKLALDFQQFWFYDEDEFIIQHLMEPENRFPQGWFQLFVQHNLLNREEWIMLVKDPGVFLRRYYNAAAREDKEGLYSSTSGSGNAISLQSIRSVSDFATSLWDIEFKHRLPTAETQEHLREPFVQFVELLLRLHQNSLHLPSYTDTMRIKDHLKRGMKEKKVHEVQRLANLVVNLVDSPTSHANNSENSPQCSQYPITEIIDIGSGQGYVTQVIGDALRGSSLPVRFYAIDDNERQLHGSSRRIEKMKSSSQEDQLEIHHLNVHFSHDAREFDAIKQKIEHQGNSLILGLHCCGDLSVACLNLFLNQPEVKAIANIGCCYHHISEPHGFPLSSFLKNRQPAFSLTSGGLSLACLSPSKWTAQNSARQFKQHSYRCAFELFLRKNHIPRCSYVGRIPKSSSVNFPSYAIGAIKKMLKRSLQMDEHDTNTDALSNLLTRENLEHDLDQFYRELHPDSTDIIKSVEVFWCLRALFANLLESIILLDRFLFLCDHNNVHVDMLRIFDESVSPRNVIFVATKEKQCEAQDSVT